MIYSYEQVQQLPSRFGVPVQRSRELVRPASALSSENNSFTSILTAEERPPIDSRLRQHDFPQAANNFAQYNVPLRDSRTNYPPHYPPRSQSSLLTLTEPDVSSGPMIPPPSLRPRIPPGQAAKTNKTKRKSKKRDKNNHTPEPIAAFNA